jgi:hypothetical protein
MPKTCAWCDAETMEWNASPNGKDICNDCEEKALEDAGEDTCELCSQLIEGGNPFSRFCDACSEVN